MDAKAQHLAAQQTLAGGDRTQRIDSAYKKLISNLDEYTKSYRALLDIVRKEKEILISSDLEKLKENNTAKEASLYKMKALDGARERYAKELADSLGTDSVNPRLLDLAQKITGPRGEQLRNVHSALDMLVRRANELNKENEEYAKSALSGLNGALENVKDTLSPKQTYGQRGTMAYGPEKTGNFVRRSG